MRIFKAFVFLAAFGAALGLSGRGAGAQAPQFHQEVKVHGAAVPGGIHDYFLTFSGPFSLPNVSLAQGTYLFRRPATGVLQVVSVDSREVYSQVLTVPVIRTAATDEFEVQFGEPSAPGAPQRLLVWFPPGAMVGQELIYVKRAGGGNSN